MKRLSQHVYIALILKIALVLFIFSISRFAFYIINKHLFEGVDFSKFLEYAYYGIKFDFASFVYVNIPFLVFSLIPFKFRTNVKYQYWLNIWFVLTNSIILIFDTIDYAYFPFTLQRSTSLILTFVKSEGNILLLMLGFALEYWFSPVIYIFIISLFLYLNSKIKSLEDFDFNSYWKYFVINISSLSFVILLSIAGLRGGFFENTRPMDNSYALKYVDNPLDVALVLNSSFSVLRTIGKKEVERYSFYDDNIVNEILPVEVYPVKKEKFKQNNVVIIMLESFGKEYTGYFNKDKEGYLGFTPFLDSLMGESKNFVNAYANGKKSIDAIPSIIAGIPSVGVHYIKSHHSANYVNALPQLLSEKGFSTSFFHGAPNGSMGFDAFCNHAGFDKYYGLNEYEEENDFEGNVWGVYDEEYFQYFGNKLKKMKQPFFTTIFSLSSHGPFVMPEKHIGKFRKGPLPVHEFVNYTDYSLKRLFKLIQNEDWFENTLFVITADHTSIPYFRDYNNGHGQFQIPLIFYQKNRDWICDDKTTAQQIDILPTILSNLNYDKPYFSIGKNLLDTTQIHFAFNHFGYSKNYQLIMNDYMYTLNLDNEKKMLFNIKKDRVLERNIIDKKPVIATKMDSLIKAGIQQYNNRMLDNSFIIK